MAPGEVQPLEQGDIEAGRNAGFSYFKMSTITPSHPVTLKVTGVSKLEGTKYPIKDKTWCYRFTLGNGQVVDVSSKAIYGEFIRRGFKDGSTTFTPFTCVIVRKSANKVGESPYIVEDATPPTP